MIVKETVKVFDRLLTDCGRGKGKVKTVEKWLLNVKGEVEDFALFIPFPLLFFSLAIRRVVIFDRRF